MKIIFRWYGVEDNITLEKIKQIPCMTGVVSAVYSIPVGGAIAIEDFEKRGYDLGKCELGLPFYGRTHGGEEAWPSYANISPDITSPFQNYVNKSYMNGGTYGDGLVTSFNGVQMIMDKTAFAHDYGLGGVMVWHYTCDVPYESEYSLFKAIQTSLNTRD